MNYVYKINQLGATNYYTISSFIFHKFASFRATISESSLWLFYQRQLEQRGDCEGVVHVWHLSEDTYIIAPMWWIQYWKNWHTNISKNTLHICLHVYIYLFTNSQPLGNIYKQLLLLSALFFSSLLLPFLVSLFLILILLNDLCNIIESLLRL